MHKRMPAGHGTLQQRSTQRMFASDEDWEIELGGWRRTQKEGMHSRRLQGNRMRESTAAASNQQRCARQQNSRHLAPRSRPTRMNSLPAREWVCYRAMGLSAVPRRRHQWRLCG
jgi:hypothetical protein